jgi:hypothetical protein
MTDPHSGAVIEVPEDLADRFSEAGYRPGAKRSRRRHPGRLAGGGHRRRRAGGLGGGDPLG